MALLALAGVALVAFAMRLGFALIVAVVLVGVGVAQTLPITRQSRAAYLAGRIGPGLGYVRSAGPCARRTYPR